MTNSTRTNEDLLLVQKNQGILRNSANQGTLYGKTRQGCLRVRAKIAEKFSGKFGYIDSLIGLTLKL